MTLTHTLATRLLWTYILFTFLLFNPFLDPFVTSFLSGPTLWFLISFFCERKILTARIQAVEVLAHLDGREQPVLSDLLFARAMSRMFCTRKKTKPKNKTKILIAFITTYCHAHAKKQNKKHTYIYIYVCYILFAVCAHFSEAIMLFFDMLSPLISILSFFLLQIICILLLTF